MRSSTENIKNKYRANNTLKAAEIDEDNFITRPIAERFKCNLYRKNIAL